VLLMNSQPAPAYQDDGNALVIDNFPVADNTFLYSTLPRVAFCLHFAASTACSVS
jgi:hypothetical protein